MTKMTNPETASENGRCIIGIDVGTGSARAGVFSTTGQMLGSAKTDIKLYRDSGSIVEQSSTEIWEAVCCTVRAAVKNAGVKASQIAGIGFDATCSLVVLGEGGKSLPVGPSNDPQRDIIVWMDHRAVKQAEAINATGHDVLKFVGGVISPEMETPKLLWLRENKLEVFDAAWQFFDLADFLTWRATGSLARSICTVTCKWTYLAHENRWSDSYFRAIGLEVLANEEFSRIGAEVVEPGIALAEGLSERAAAELGLASGTPVGAGLIDAHAGGIGTVGADGDPTECLGYVFGTSSCTMTTTKDPVFVPGIWGPYYSAMVPKTWLNEGGQSAAGAAIDQLLTMHPAAQEARARAAAAGVSLPVWLADIAAEKAATHSEAIYQAGGIHVVPEFLGNRAPFADPQARAIIAGLGMDSNIDSLVALYVAGICSIGYGLRQIIQTQASNGAPIKRITISGGAGQQDLVRQLLADTTGKPVVATASEEPVLLGSAILGGIAGRVFPNMMVAMRSMSSSKAIFEPTSGRLAELHVARFGAFRRLQSVAREVQRMA